MLALGVLGPSQALAQVPGRFYWKTLSGGRAVPLIVNSLSGNTNPFDPSHTVTPGANISATLALAGFAKTYTLLGRSAMTAVLLPMGRLSGEVVAAGRTFDALLNIGHRPTFGGETRTIEAHLLHVELSESPPSAVVRLVDRLRPERRFESPAALSSQIADDVANARRLFAPFPGPSGPVARGLFINNPSGRVVSGGLSKCPCRTPPAKANPPIRRRSPVRARRAAARPSAAARCGCACSEAALGCLMEQGHAGVTTAAVEPRAGVSRGARMHHFPTKADLLIAAMEHLFLRLRESFEAKIRPALADAEVPAGERFPAAFNLLWSNFLDPRHAAVVELFMLARSDAELRERLRDVAARHHATMQRRAQAYFPEAGPDLAALGPQAP